MPLRLNVGLQKKVGQPNYGSLGAACHVELELEAALLERDLAEFQRRVAATFDVCRQAIEAELSRPEHRRPEHHNGSAAADAPAATVRRATSAQVRALHALAARCGWDLAAALQERYGVSQPDALPRIQASCLIRELNAAADAAAESERWNGSANSTG